MLTKLASIFQDDPFFSPLNFFRFIPYLIFKYRSLYQSPAYPLVISYPKCGRTWLRNIVFQLDPPLNFTYTHYLASPHFWHISPASSLAPRRIDPNTSFLLHRDPRDVVVSQFHQTLNRDLPNLLRHEKRSHTKHLLKSKQINPPSSLSDFVVDPHWGIERVFSFNLSVLNACVSIPVLHYERLHIDTFTELTSFFSSNGFNFDESSLRNACDNCSFSRLQAQEVLGVQDPSLRITPIANRDNSNVNNLKLRRGVVGGWVDEIPLSLHSKINLLTAKYYSRLLAIRPDFNSIIPEDLVDLVSDILSF